MSEEKLGFDSRTTQSFLDTRQKCLFELGRKEEAMRAGIESYDKSLDALVQPSMVTAGLAMFIADANVQLDQRVESCRFYGIAHSLYAELQGTSGIPTLWGLFYLSNDQAFLKDYVAAEKYSRKLIDEIPEKSLIRSLLTRAAEATLGEALCEQGKFEEGKAFLIKA